MYTPKGTLVTLDALDALELSALAFDLEAKCKYHADARLEDYRMIELVALIESTNHCAIQIFSVLDESSQTTKPQSSPAVQTLRDTADNHVLVNDSVAALMELLITSGLSALDQFHEMRPNLDSSWANEVAALDTALNRLDFDAALDTCRYLEERLRTSA
jgi:hypothetical protein